MSKEDEISKKVKLRKKKVKASESKEISSDERNPFRDLLGFVLFFMSVFFGLSLFTYHPLDPSWNTGIQAHTVIIQNYGGIIGSYLADFCIQALGYASYFLPFLIFSSSFIVVFRPRVKSLLAPMFGLILFLISASVFLTVLNEGKETKIAWGGGTGLVLHLLFSSYTGKVGSVLAALMFATCGAVLTLRLRFDQFLKALSRLKQVPGFLLEKLKPVAKKAHTHLDEVLDREEGNFLKGMDAIRLDAEPKLPTIEAKPKKKPEDKPLEIPIRIQKKTDSPKLVEFHSLEDELSQSVKAKTGRTDYKLPEVDLLQIDTTIERKIDRDELFENAQTLERKLKDFGVFGKVVEVQPGPVVTMYEFEPAPGVKVNQISRLGDDLALALKAMSVRIALIPGKAVIGIEVANQNREVVYLREIIDDEGFQKSISKLTFALGKDISGSPYLADLRRMPHLLVAGATGSGKSVAINSMIVSILYEATPEQVRMILVDPKMLELNLYDDIPHLLLPVVTDPRKAATALRWAVLEMERRYRLMADIGVRNIEGYNKKVPSALQDQAKRKEEEEREMLEGGVLDSTPPSERKRDEHTGELPYIMIVIDELADLMMVSGREVEESIVRLAQMARAAGIHLLLATQRPSVDVITGVIKANMPARISFQVSSKTDSRTILDANGAELLLGAGDMLFLPPGTSKLERVHGAFVSDAEVKAVTDHWKAQAKPSYNEEILKVQIESDTKSEMGEGEDEEMYQQALGIVRGAGAASISMIQRKLRIGYNRAARLVERMDEEGILLPGEVGKPRQVRMTQFEDGF